MLAPIRWLERFLDITMPIDQFVSKMIMSGIGIEGYSEVAPEISNVAVGKILSVEKHPNADALVVCQVEVGGERPLQICTAAKNVFPGALVPVALNGAHLAGDIKIKTTKMRGEASEGMFCSYEELGIPQEMYPSAPSDGILIFEEDYAPGTDVKSIFGLDDIVIDFDILSNRPDCQSIYGVAREISCALGVPLKKPALDFATVGGSVHDYISVVDENEVLCPRFCGAIVKDITIAPSPMWMRNLLHACGLRPINNIVDITNFIMKECGQPMHSYDLGDIRGSKIIVRNAKEGEVLRTLDGKDRVLTTSMLAICDGEGVTGLAGIMGGENSEIKPTTTTVFFEAASFDFASVRTTARKLGMRTDASSLFEKGVNAACVMDNLCRALNLVGELGAGQIVDGMIDIYPQPKVRKEIVSDIAYLHRLMGVDVPADTMVDILNRLGIDSRAEGDTIVSLAPLHRDDLELPADIAEEVLRIYGFDKLPSTLPVSAMHPGDLGEKFTREYALRSLLTGAGFCEAMTYSFTSPSVFNKIGLAEDDPRRNYIAISNPLGEDYSVMRTTAIPAMLQSLSNNYTRGVAEAALFEQAKIYIAKALPLTELPDERPMLTLGAYGGDWDFYALKGVIELFFAAHGIKGISYVRANETYLHPGRSAYIMMGETCLGELGQVHPDVADRYSLGVSYVAQLDLGKIYAAESALEEAKMPPKFPAVSRDLAFLMDADVPAGDVLAAIQKACGKLYESASIFDIYQGKGVPEGQKSVAYTFAIRASDRTLTEDEVTKVVNKILKAAKDGFNAVLRA